MAENNVIRVDRYLLLGQLENRIDRLTAACLVHGAPQPILDQVESLHRITKALRKQLKEEQRQRLLEELEASVKLTQKRNPDDSLGAVERKP